MKNVFINEGRLILLEKLNDESLDILNERANFIFNYKKNKNINYEEIVKLSILWSNVKFKNCKYNNNIMKMLF